MLIYDPVLKCEAASASPNGSTRAIPSNTATSCADVVRQASWGYINYEIADVIRVDGFPIKVDGFRSPTSPSSR